MGTWAIHAQGDFSGVDALIVLALTVRQLDYKARRDPAVPTLS
jgi:hypothetical protein